MGALTLIKAPTGRELWEDYSHIQLKKYFDLSGIEPTDPVLRVGKLTHYATHGLFENEVQYYLYLKHAKYT